jgi:hypothetical protein
MITASSFERGVAAAPWSGWHFSDVPILPKVGYEAQGGSDGDIVKPTRLPPERTSSSDVFAAVDTECERNDFAKN